MKIEDLCHNGAVFDRVSFVAEASVKIAAGMIRDGASVLGDAKVAAWAFDTAEALWAELLKRFPDDSESADTEKF